MGANDQPSGAVGRGAVPPVDRLLDLTGRVVVVTGAGGNIGAGIARRFSEAGADVVLHHRRSGAEAATVLTAIAEAGGNAVGVQADLTDAAEVPRLTEAAVGAFGRVDILVNNAGVQPLAAFLDTTAEAWDAMMAGNLRSVFLCTRSVARRMIEQGGGGAVVNIASIEGENPAPMHGHYSASKAGVLMHTRAAALELGAYGIRVNAVSPGLIDRDGLAEQWPEGVARWHAAAPLRRLGRPDDVADACLFLASSAARWISGANVRVDGGVLARPTW